MISGQIIFVVINVFAYINVTDDAPKEKQVQATVIKDKHNNY